MTCPPRTDPSLGLDFGSIKRGSHGQKTVHRRADIKYLREAESFVSQGQSVREVSRKIGITEQTYYRWRKEYGGMGLSQAKRLKNLEKEN